MPTVSESLAKLSASMAELSQRAKEAEDHMAAARKETHEQLETRVAEARQRRGKGRCGDGRGIGCES